MKGTGSLTTAEPAKAVPDENLAPSAGQEQDDDGGDTQDISGRNINPAKLTALLRSKFGIGQYKVYMMYNCYYVKAPKKLSLSEIAQCRRR